MTRPRHHSKSTLIEFVLTEADRFGVAMYVLEEQAGLAKGTIGNWARDKYEPKVGNLLAAGNVLGYELCWRPKYVTTQNGEQTHVKVDFPSSSVLGRLYKVKEHLRESGRTLSDLEAVLIAASGVTLCTPSIQKESKLEPNGQPPMRSSKTWAPYKHLSG